MNVPDLPPICSILVLPINFLALKLVSDFNSGLAAVDVVCLLAAQHGILVNLYLRSIALSSSKNSKNV